MLYGLTAIFALQKEIEESSRSDIKAKEVSSSTNETSSNYDLRQRKVEAISS